MAGKKQNSALARANSKLGGGRNTSVNPDDPSLPQPIREAIERFHRCEEWESETRTRNLHDLKFAYADPDNKFAWPDDIYNDRQLDDNPCLTVNMVRQHNLKIINEARRSQPGIRVKATGGGASFDSAQVYSAVCRRIEYNSRAQLAYTRAVTDQVNMGIGYWRVVTEYTGADSFDQEIYIRPVQDRFSVYLDPDCKQADGSDARYAIVFDTIPKDLAKKRYPKYAEFFGTAALGANTGWITKDEVRIAEYFRVVETDDTLVQFEDPVTKQPIKTFLSELDKDLRATIEASATAVRRKTTRRKIEWFLIVGEAIAQEAEWPGKYIPIVRLVGEETQIDGILDYKGHTRYLKDPQRIYNYWTSSAVENVALNPKSPYIAPAQAIEEHQDIWKDANRNKAPVLPYNQFDDDGNELREPRRIETGQVPVAIITGMQTAREELMLASGQFNANLGQQGNERSADAIFARTEQGDNSTYHFMDNLSASIRYTGMILIDLIPKIYDTERLLLIVGEDGQEQELRLDPNAEKAYKESKVAGEDGQVQKIVRIFNPVVGNYEVESEVGPGYATKRQEAFNAIKLILTQAPDLTNVVGDLLFQSADFPLADQIAQRMRRMVPPHILGDGPSPQEQAMQAQLQELQGMLQMMGNELQQLQLKLVGKEQLRDIDAFNAQTKRIDTLGKLAQVPQQDTMALIQQVVMEALQTSLGPIITSISGMNAGPDEPGASAPMQGMAPPQGPGPAQGQLPPPGSAPMV